MSSPVAKAWGIVSPASLAVTVDLENVTYIEDPGVGLVGEGTEGNEEG